MAMILCWMVDYVVYRIGQYYKYVGYWISQYDDNKYIYTYVCIYIYIYVCIHIHTYTTTTTQRQQENS